MGDPNLNNGMMTKVWGPAGWLFLHSVSFGYPLKIDNSNSSKKIEYKVFFESIGDILPCKYCRESYNKYIQEIPIDDHLNSRDELVKWLYLIHNKVNNKLNVPECDIPTLEEVKEKYEKYRAKCKQSFSETEVKGCVIPKDGVKKFCKLSIVDEKEFFTNNDINYCLIFVLIVIIIILILCFLFKNKNLKII
jgi:hypothetical protein